MKGGSCANSEHYENNFMSTPTSGMKTPWRSDWTLFPPFGHTPPKNDSRPHIQPLDTAVRLLALFC